MAHFVEHMVFKGTRRRRGHHINQRMEAVGGYLNALTAKDHTCYYARALDDQLERALDVVLDLVIEPVFPEKEIVKEKEVVIEELRMYADNPEDYVFDLYELALYPDDALGRPVIGTEESVRNFSRESITRFVDCGYAPNRLVISLAGNVDHDEAVRLATRMTAEINREVCHTERYAPMAEPVGEIRERRPIQQAHVVLGMRAWGLHDSRRSDLSVLNTVLGGGMSSRLNQNIRERHGYCYNVYSFANMYQDVGDFGIYLGVDGDRIDRAARLARRQLEDLATTIVSPRALERAKTQLRGSMMLGLESMNSRMMRLGRAELHVGGYQSPDEAAAEVAQVTAEGVRAAAEALLAGPQSMIVLEPAG